MELNKRNMRKIKQLIIFTVILFVGLLNLDVIISTMNWLFGILMPFIIGCAIAFIISVPMRLFEEKLFLKGKSNHKILAKIRRPLSILLSLITIIGLIFIVIFLIAPELSDTVANLFETIPNFFEKTEGWVKDLEQKYPEIAKYLSEYELDWEKLSTTVMNLAESVGTGLFNSTFTFIGSIVNTLANLVIGLVFAIYILANKENLAQQGKKILYGYLSIERADRIVSVLKLTHTSFSNFISGQCVEAVIEGCVFFLVLSIFNFDYALLIGVLTGFMALIPIFGAFIGAAIGFLLLFMASPAQGFWFILIFIVIQQIESNLLYPYIVGGSIGLPSIWVLFGVSVGGSLLGLVGMLVFIPLCSVFYVLLRDAVHVRLKTRNIPKEKYEDPYQLPLANQHKDTSEHAVKEEMEPEVEEIVEDAVEQEAKEVANVEIKLEKEEEDNIKKKK